LFGKSREEQRMCWEELQHHVGILHPMFLRKGGKPPEIPDSTLLVTNTARPNDPPKVLERLPETLIADLIVIPLDAFIERVVTAVNRVESVLQSQEMQKMDLHTEQSLHTTITGGNALLEALRERERESKREEIAGTRVIIEPDAAKAVVEAHAALVMSDYEYAPSKAQSEQAWSVVNISEHGAGLERVCHDPMGFEVGSLIGLSWIPHQGEPMLGVVRWIKEPKPGEQRIGLKFLRARFKLFKAALLGGGRDELTEHRSWPVLIGAGKGAHPAIFPDPRIYRNMVFVISHEGARLHFKVRRVRTRGPNYSICEIVRAEELSKSGRLDFSA
ncbi:MAG: PilZ domain-containing protein, partial [Mariprofundaceae bacterium]